MWTGFYIELSLTHAFYVFGQADNVSDFSARRPSGRNFESHVGIFFFAGVALRHLMLKKGKIAKRIQQKNANFSRETEYKQPVRVLQLRLPDNWSGHVAGNMDRKQWRPIRDALPLKYWVNYKSVLNSQMLLKWRRR